MYSHILEEFIASGYTLRVYEGDKLIFSSTSDRLLPLLEFIETGHRGRPVVFDKIVGNAAALLCARAGVAGVYSPKGSQAALPTLERYGIKYHFTEILPFIEKPGGGMCPMEKLSLGKEPEEFYQAITEAIRARRGG